MISDKLDNNMANKGIDYGEQQDIVIKEEKKEDLINLKKCELKKNPQKFE